MELFDLIEMYQFVRGTFCPPCAWHKNEMSSDLDKKCLFFEGRNTVVETVKELTNISAERCSFQYVLSLMLADIQAQKVSHENNS